MENKTCFRRFGTMLDCSRNAVMNPDSLKKWIDITADLGYNTLLLYTEDTYEVDNHPYFGYMRGRYTQAQLQEIDRYAAQKGMELIPCIQTLAHLNAIVRWPQYAPHVDTADILLAGDDAVYELIDSMFASISKCFTSRTINIGMDEAHMIGRGRYYDLHGDSDRSQILVEHIKKVSEIGKKYGFTLAMWSDMFFRLATGGDYYAREAHIKESVREQIPDNVTLIYWDYYSTEKERYDRMLTSHEKIKAGTWFAGGLWSWTGFAPHNGYSMNAACAALTSCQEHGIQDVFLTMWGDDGAECPRFSLLPSLFYASELAKGNSDMQNIRQKFGEKFGISFDDFMLLDLPDTPGGKTDEICDAEKYLLYNDCFTGLVNSTLTGGENGRYAGCAKRLAKWENHPQWGYLFATAKALCETLSCKAELSAKTREIYASRDREALKGLIDEYRTLLARTGLFYTRFKKQWFTENKPHGFDVQDIRLGGLIQRIKSCMERLQDLYEGNITVIEELEEKPLDFHGNGAKFGQKHVSFNSWKQTVTANVI